MDFEGIVLSDYSEEEVEVLKKFICQTLDRASWPFDFIDYASEHDIEKLKAFKVNILLEAFRKYYTNSEYKINQVDKLANMQEALKFANIITSIYPHFSFKRLENEDIEINVEIHSAMNNLDLKKYSLIPGEIPFSLLQNISKDSSSKTINNTLSYFKALETIYDVSNDKELEPVNEFLSEYLKSNIRLNWIDYSIIQSYLSRNILKSLYYYDLGQDAWFKLAAVTNNGQQFLHFEIFNKTTLSPNSITNICINILETIFLPVALVLSLISSSYILFLIFTCLYLLQLQWYLRHRNDTKLRKNFAENLSLLSKIKYDLANGPVDKNYLIELLKKADESNYFHLASLITFLKDSKEEYLIITTRINMGLNQVISTWQSS